MTLYTSSMSTLGKYIDWHQSRTREELYEWYGRTHDASVPGFVSLGRVDLPWAAIRDMAAGLGERPVWMGQEANYHTQMDPRLDSWARHTFPRLLFIECWLQTQTPGQTVRPHLDSVGRYLEKCARRWPGLRRRTHSQRRPGVDVHVYMIACQPHVKGQLFGFHNPGPWRWRRGECIRIDPWRALHWTANHSDRARRMIKITGIDPGRPAPCRAGK